MGNLALDYEKKERLENARSQQARLRGGMHADNYAGAGSNAGKMPGAHLGGVRHADHYPGVRLGEKPRDLRLKSSAGKDIPLEGSEKSSGQEDHASRLEESRKRKPGSIGNAALQVKNMAELATPMGAFSLLKQVNLLGDMPFVAALGAAILKDILDLAFNIFLIGALFSILCSIFIFMMIYLAGAGGKRNEAGGLMRKGLAIVAGGLTDAFPGLGFLPIETLTVGIIYAMVLAERRAAENEE